jgi:steroid Delta-isomerase
VAATLDLLRQHVEDHNAGVRTGDFAPMLARFTDSAELSFEGVPAGPFRGVDAIAAAYRERPPDDVIRTFDERVEGDDVVASYAWSREPDVRAGELRVTVRDGRITRVLVSFV